jgi:hypothetical protein
MEELNLDIIVVPTYNVASIGIADNTTYPTDPIDVENPFLQINIPNFGDKIVAFIPGTLNVYGSEELGISEEGDTQYLPDGIYHIKYTVNPPLQNFKQISFYRVNNLQERFDNAFLTLEIMECDGPLKKQAKEDLTTIYFYIQGAVSAANNCAYVEANKLYKKANKMLDTFLKNDCGCYGVTFANQF